MHKIYRNVIDPKIISSINSSLDNKLSEGFEILIPPESEQIIQPFRLNLIVQCPDIHFNDKTYTVIRTATNNGNRASQAWHFDNFSETVLIVLKTAGNNAENGDILIRNNLRKTPNSVLWYSLTKIFWTNPISWFILRIKWIRDRFFTRVPLAVGDVMIFDGSTTFHGNLPIASGVRRSILIHNYPLFENSAITRLFHKLNKIYLYKTKK